MKTIITPIFANMLLILLLVLPNGIIAGETSSMRCGCDIVEVGYYKYHVLKKCGTPDYKEMIRIGTTKQPKVNQWIYQRYGYFYCLTFKDGKLVKIESIRN